MMQDLWLSFLLEAALMAIMIQRLLTQQSETYFMPHIPTDGLD